MKNFEELPEDKAETKPEAQDNHFADVGKMVLSPEVKEAMEELEEKQLKVLPTSGYYNSGVRWHSCYNDLLNKAKNLLNALDKQFAYTLEPKEKDVLDDKIKEFNNKSKAEPLKAEDLKVNKTTESVDVKEEEVKEKIYTIPIIYHCAVCDELIGHEKDVLLRKYDKPVCSFGCAHELKQEEESIWKPVSELPTNNAHCLVKCNDANKNRIFSAVFLAKEQAKGNKGFVDLAAQHLGGMNYSKEYITLTDFINDYEKLKERVEKLENKLLSEASVNKISNNN